MKIYLPSKLPVALALIITTASLSAYAQKSSRKDPRKGDDAALIQQTAVQVLDSVIDELKEIQDIEARIGIEDSLLKLLASRRPERCRQMLDALFNDALSLSRRNIVDNDRPKRPDADSTIRKVIQIAAAFDRELAQSYIEKYLAAEDSDDREAKSHGPAGISAAELYLKIAAELAERDPAAAVSIAKRSLSLGVPPAALVFLATLRKKDMVLANSFLGAELSSIGRKGGSNINELLLLYSYVFSPLQVAQLVPQGVALLSIAGYGAIAENYPTDPALARLYLETAGQILLNPVRLYPGNVERLEAGPQGDFIFISIIARQIDRYLPALAAPLSAQRDVLAAYLQPNQRTQSQASFERWNNLQNRVNQSSGDKLDTAPDYLQLAEQTSDPKRKSQLYYRAAIVAVREKRYEAALEIVEKLSSEYRDQARQFIRYHIAIQAARNQQHERAEEWARHDSDIVRRAYIFTLIAGSLLEGKREDTTRSIEFLNEVEQLGAKLETNSDRVAVLTGGAAVASRCDTVRAFDLLREAVRAANKVEDFNGNTRIARSLEIGGFYFDYSMYADDFTLTEVITHLGRADFNQTLQEVRVMKNRLPRIRGLVALCGGVLAKEPVKKLSSK